MRIILNTLLAITFVVAANAQETETALLKQANTEFSELRFAYAIPLYKRHIQLNSNDANATLQLAKCYQINNQYDSAIKYTKVAIALGAKSGNMLPELLANKGDYAAAIAAYSSINTPLAVNRSKGFNNLTSFSNNELNYSIHYLSINTAFNEFAAVSFKDGLIFESNRAAKINGRNEFGWDGSAYSKLYFTNNKSNLPIDSAVSVKWSEKTFAIATSELSKETSNDVNTIITKKYDYKQIPFQKNQVSYFQEDLNSAFNVGAISFSADTSVAYFTRNQAPSKSLIKSNENEKHLLEIWSATVSNGKLSNFKKLAFNNANASYFHPVLSKDEKRLYFISDQLGGVGGTDLYYAIKDAQGNWGSPVNAGDKVNTTANELYPTLADGELYISSNGHAGLGGLDIFKVEFQNGNIVGVENLGTPINGSTDDMSFTKHDNKGYFVSNRAGSDDIYSFEYSLKKVKVSGNVITSDGTKPVINVKLYSENHTTILDSANLDANGSYSFLVTPAVPFFVEATDNNGNKAAMSANAKGYVKNGNEYFKKLADLVINIPAPLPKVEVAKKTIDNIIDSLKDISESYLQLHHNFDKVSIVNAELKSYNKIISSVKKLKNKKIVVLSAADCFGTDDYNEKLSARRSDAIGGQLHNLNRKNSVVKMHVGERILQIPCNPSATEQEQLTNRYTYVFILK